MTFKVPTLFSGRRVYITGPRNKVKGYIELRQLRIEEVILRPELGQDIIFDPISFKEELED